jgi:hypothetical protein
MHRDAQQGVGSMEEVLRTADSTPVEPALRRRVDPRTGKEMVCHPSSFWEEHERQRAASGLSIGQYCERHGLALSTLRRWSAKLQGREARLTPRPTREVKAATSPTGFLSVPIVPAHDDRGASESAPDARPAIEVLTRSGARVRLFGQAADDAIRAVMAELAGAR